ncbi:hypothetical protein C2E23DRAFT_624627 [Lenzites betulinus]|nr:hypothetical protein C2E23DRAFT_624627 [Lenzites betulinus]
MAIRRAVLWTQPEPPRLRVRLFLLLIRRYLLSLLVSYLPIAHPEPTLCTKPQPKGRGKCCSERRPERGAIFYLERVLTASSSSPLLRLPVTRTRSLPYLRPE